MSAGRDERGDLGYIRTGIRTGRRKPPGRNHSACDREANQSVNTLRVAAERAFAHLKDQG
ncbi:hypothetical protein ACFXPT_32600 [Streptomyces goshikiensis]|uniref:hypothetical protein n=1 Tax=Streptomyces goshikiensis TaxID=1942 RepID=UPI00369DA915